MTSARGLDLPTGTVTFLFTDIEGSTRLLLRFGDDYVGLLDRHADIMRAALAAHGGVEVQTEGDAFFVAFGSAPAAVAAAVEAQRALHAEPWPAGAEIRVRMGLHTGEGRMGGDDYAGIDVNRAARIASVAHGGQILVSVTTHALLADSAPEGVRSRDLGQHRLKDLPEPIGLFQLDIAGLPHEFPPLKSLDVRPTNIPPADSPLIGRSRELDELRSLLSGRRLVTLTGAGGSGKTRLALELGTSLRDAFDDGVFMVPLEEATDRPAVAGAIAKALGVREHADHDVEASLAAHLRDRRALLILDNMEQAIVAAPLVGELLSWSPDTSVLVTSRTVLRIASEQEYAVDPLELPGSEVSGANELASNPAVALFVARAAELKPDVMYEPDELADVAAICRRLDGLPLAIELAAARTRLLRPRAILQRLEQALPLLTGGARDRPGRQQTLAAAIEWSYRLLDEDECRLLGCLAVFAGGWDLEAAERVCGDTIGAEADVLGGSTSLIEKSFIRISDAEADEPRFGMLRVIAEYASGRSADDPKLGGLAREHASWVIELVEAAAPELVGRSLGAWQARLLLEEGNIRAALGWSIDTGSAASAARIAGSLWRFWHFHGRVREGIDWLERTVALLSEGGVSLEQQGRVWSSLGSMRYWTGDLERAEAAYLRAVELLEEGDDAQALADARFDLAWPAAIDGRREEALSRFEAAREAYERANDPAGIAIVEHDRVAIGYLWLDDRSYEQAVEVSLRARAVLEGLDRLHEAVGVDVALISIHRQAGRRQAAAKAVQRAVGEMMAVGDLGRLGEVLKMTAAIELDVGRPEKAVRLATATARHAAALGGNLTDRILSDDILEAAGEVLTPEQLRTEIEAGRQMTIVEAAAEVIGGVDP